MTMSKISCFLNKDMSSGERVRHMQVSAEASDSVFVTILIFCSSWMFCINFEFFFFKSGSKILIVIPEVFGAPLDFTLS